MNDRLKLVLLAHLKTIFFGTDKPASQPPLNQSYFSGQEGQHR
jgi:hypothetical protein